MKMSENIFKKSMIFILSSYSSQLRLTKSCLVENTEHYFHYELGYREPFNCYKCLEMLGVVPKESSPKGGSASTNLVYSYLSTKKKKNGWLSRSKVSQPNLFCISRNYN